MKKFCDTYLKKLHIGNITTESNVLMAPLAGYTAYPFRMICRSLGAGLAFTEMVSANGLKYNDKARAMDGNDMFREVERSVENLGTIPDIYFVHQVDEKNQDEVFGRYGAVDALCDLKKAGLIRFTGIATHYYSVAERSARDDRVDVI